MRKSIGMVALATAAALVFTGCTSDGGDGGDDSTLYVLMPDTEMGWDPATNVNFPSTYLGLVQRRLTTWAFTADGVEVVPDLATDIGTPNEDGSVWTFTLKDDIFFEDGTPITSADIKFGVERTFDDELAGGLHYHNALLVGGSEYTGPYDGAGELASIETPDDKTIVFNLTQPFGDWPWLTAMNPFVPVPVGEGEDIAAYDQQSVASGPYRIESNEAGNETVLVRNEYWEPSSDDARTAEYDSIVFRQSQNPSTVAQTLISDVGDAQNSINSSGLSAAELALVSADPAASERLITSDGGLEFYVALNNDSEELDDILVRQAVQYAVDREAIVLALGGEEAAVATSTVIPNGINGHEESDLYPRDVEKAKELLAEAGYADGVTLDLWVANEDTAAAEALQQALAEADITVNIAPLDLGVMYGDAMGGNPNYDMFLSYWIGDYPSPGAYIELLFQSQYIDGGYNLARMVEPGIDAAIADAIAEPDIDAAVEKWTAIDQSIMETGSFLPLYLTRNAFLPGSGIAAFEVPAFPSYPNYLTLSQAG